MADPPEDVVERVEHLTRRARETRDEDVARSARNERDALLAEYDHAARVREEDDRAVLVCYPEEWLEEGTAALGRIEDTDRAVERPLAGATDADWEVVAARNDAVVAAVADEHGEVHAANARALADYAANHHATTIDRLTDEHLVRFREEYYPRNVWPSDEQATVLEESIAIVQRTCESASDTPPE